MLWLERTRVASHIDPVWHTERVGCLIRPACEVFSPIERESWSRIVDHLHRQGFPENLLVRLDHRDQAAPFSPDSPGDNLHPSLLVDRGHDKDEQEYDGVECCRVYLNSQVSEPQATLYFSCSVFFHN